MPTVDTDPTLDPILNAMGDFARDRGVTMVVALARLESNGAVVVRCKGFSRGENRKHAQAMLECLESLTELRAHAEAPLDDPETVH